MANDYPVYERVHDGKPVRYTGLSDHSGSTPTPLMTDKKYGELTKALNDPATKMHGTLDEMNKAMDAAKAQKKPFNSEAFLADKLKAREFFARMATEHGATHTNVLDVHADLKKPAHLREGQMRALNVGGMPTLSQNTHLAEHVSGVNRASGGVHKVATSFAKKAGVVGTAVAAGMALTGGASAAEVADGMLPTNLAGQKSLCEQFGEAATTVASWGAGAAVGVTSSSVLTPVGGLAVGVGTQAAVEHTGRHLTGLVCGQ